MKHEKMKNTNKNTKIMIITLIIMSLMSYAQAIGVSPAKIEITLNEETKNQEYTINIVNMNNQEKNFIIETTENSFIELITTSATVKETDKSTPIIFKIKNQDYEAHQEAQIIITQQTTQEDTVTARLGLIVPIIVKSPKQEGHIKAQIQNPTRISQATLPFIIRLENEGLKRIEQAKISLEINHETKEKTITLEPLEKKDVPLNINKLPKGKHEIKTTITQGNEKEIIIQEYISGFPELTIKNIKKQTYTNQILELELNIISDWPEPINDVKITGKTSNFETTTENFEINKNKKINMYIRLQENQEETLTLIINEQEPQEYTIKIKNNKLWINGKKQTNNTITYLVIIIALISILIIIVTRLNKIKKRLMKMKEPRHKLSQNKKNQTKFD